MNFSHGRMGRFMPSISFDKPAMYLRGHNDFNDSRQGPLVTAPDLKLLDAQGEAMMRVEFGVDADHIRRVFGYVSAARRLAQPSRYSVKMPVATINPAPTNVRGSGHSPKNRYPSTKAQIIAV